jgi:hypothetical protein
MHFKKSIDVLKNIDMYGIDFNYNLVNNYVVVKFSIGETIKA